MWGNNMDKLLYLKDLPTTPYLSNQDTTMQIWFWSGEFAQPCILGT